MHGECICEVLEPAVGLGEVVRIEEFLREDHDWIVIAVVESVRLELRCDVVRATHAVRRQAESVGDRPRQAGNETTDERVPRDRPHDSGAHPS
jgi:hypothetical protein